MCPLRSVLIGHTAHPGISTDVEALNHALAHVPVRLTFTDSGYHLASALDTPTGHALARLLDAIRQCGEDQTWTRLKACAPDTCRWAFYDASRHPVPLAQRGKTPPQSFGSPSGRAGQAP